MVERIERRMAEIYAGTVELIPCEEVRAELREARHWYFERSPLSAMAFAHEVDHAVVRIREAPERYPLASVEANDTWLSFPYRRTLFMYRMLRRQSASGRYLSRFARIGQMFPLPTAPLSEKREKPA
jgi:hypothetical protein